jgi:hypothetical protein
MAARIKLHLDSDRFRWIDSKRARRLRKSGAAMVCSKYPYELRLRRSAVAAFMEEQGEIIHWSEKSGVGTVMNGKLLRRVPA